MKSKILNSFDKQKNFTFDKTLKQSVKDCKNNVINKSKIKIIDNMIEGLIKLKTLVVDEDNVYSNYFPKIAKQSNLKQEIMIDKVSIEKKPFELRKKSVCIEKTLHAITMIQADQLNQEERSLPMTLHSSNNLKSKKLSLGDNQINTTNNKQHQANSFKSAIKR